VLLINERKKKMTVEITKTPLSKEMNQIPSQTIPVPMSVSQNVYLNNTIRDMEISQWFDERIDELNEENSPKTSKPISDIVKKYTGSYIGKYPVSQEQKKLLRDMAICRTAALGGHVDQCDCCDYLKVVYNSCRNRGCPTCQGLDRERWIEARKAEILECGYFHAVFTLPHHLNPLIFCNQKLLLDLLFKTVSGVLQDFAGDPQWRLNGKLGIIMVLHTWNQKLLDHFHLHCLIPAGALSFDEKKWTPCRKKFLFRTESIAKAFRKRYINGIESLFKNGELVFAGKSKEYATQEGFQSLMKKLWSNKWVVYAKKPFAGPEQVLSYLGRYTHRIAISNSRIVSETDGKVTFKYKDRKDENKEKELEIDAVEFVRRYLLHVLPKRFVKIRYFGFLFHRTKKEKIEIIRKLIGQDTQTPETKKETIREMMLRLTGEDITLCPKCKRGRLKTALEFPRFSSIRYNHERYELMNLLDELDL